ncbi:hypothetical protein SeLEV6574_g08259 [Synchytrium endobioticum]|uniref:Uncharacterized protein n=1 Tax=Synchytrium endobioticum TaxID=286115 RepID=A0A507CAT3_9FUNG|nr:hypothetical protein SeLEV6574_g08259 [Synchytrium endobioticum]
MDSFRISGINMIPKFDGKVEQYRKWRNAIEDVALANGLGCLVVNEISRGTKYSEADWAAIDLQLKGVIKLSISDEVRYSVEDDYTVSTTRFLNKMDDRFAAIVSNLKSIKFDMDELYSLVYLRMFNDQYEIFRQVLLASETTPSLDNLVKRMLSKETEMVSSTGVDDVAFRAEINKERQRSKIRCSNCKKLGHTIDSCYFDGGGNVDKRPSWFKNYAQRDSNHDTAKRHVIS